MGATATGGSRTRPIPRPPTPEEGDIFELRKKGLQELLGLQQVGPRAFMDAQGNLLSPAEAEERLIEAQRREEEARISSSLRELEPFERELGRVGGELRPIAAAQRGIAVEQRRIAGEIPLFEKPGL